MEKLSHTPVWNEINNRFPNFNGLTVDIWEWIGNFFPRIIVLINFNAGIKV